MKTLMVFIFILAPTLACVPLHKSTKSVAIIHHYPLIVEARWTLRAPKLRIHARWESCWTQHDIAYASWIDPIGRNIASLWIEKNLVTWDNRTDKVRWIWVNDPEGWKAVVGIPLSGDEIRDWLMGVWTPRTEFSEPRPEVMNGLNVYSTQAIFQGFSVTVWHFADHRIWRQEWKTPWNASVNFEYRYPIDSPIPGQLVWKWVSDRDIDDGFTMRWDQLQWEQGTCRIPSLPDANAEHIPVYRVEDNFTGSNPMIVELFHRSQ